jgi:hypothetical protein
MKLHHLQEQAPGRDSFGFGKIASGSLLLQQKTTNRKKLPVDQTGRISCKRPG